MTSTSQVYYISINLFVQKIPPISYKKTHAWQVEHLMYNSCQTEGRNGGDEGGKGEKASDETARGG